MNTLFRMLLMLVSFIAIASRSLAAGAVTASPPGGSCAAAHVLVRFKPEARARLPDGSIADQLEALGARLNLPAGAKLQETPLARMIRAKTESSSRAEPLRVDLDQFLYLRLPSAFSVAECLRRLEHHPLLEYAEPDWIGTVAETIPSDPNFADQWHHQNSLKPSASIQTPLAWDITRGSSNAVVAVLDTGLADELPEFAGRVVPGYNFAYTNEVTLDDNGHGTQVAGLLCASANNASLGAGVDWHCRIMPIKVFADNNTGFYSSWAQGIDYAVGNGCKVINLSGGGTDFSRTVQRAISNAVAQGVIFVTSAGNDGNTNLSFPGYLTVCITVGATDSQDRKAGFSNAGAQIDLVAPGQDVLTVGRFGTLESVSGTSFSTPLVAGVCALLAALRPNLNQAEARQLLCAGADDQVGGDTDPPGFDNQHGWGRLNAFNSLRLATTRVDVIERTNDTMHLSWLSPGNAGSRHPYQVEYRPSFGAAWIPLTNANAFRYESHRTHWIDDGWQTSGGGVAGFYRVGLRPF
jgi:subtilisin family serine protease